MEKLRLKNELNQIEIGMEMVIQNNNNEIISKGKDKILFESSTNNIELKNIKKIVLLALEKKNELKQNESKQNESKKNKLQNFKDEKDNKIFGLEEELRIIKEERIFREDGITKKIRMEKDNMKIVGNELETQVKTIKELNLQSSKIHITLKEIQKPKIHIKNNKK